LLGHRPKVALPLVLAPHLVERTSGSIRQSLRNASLINAQIWRSERGAEASLQKIRQNVRILWRPQKEVGQDPRHLTPTGRSLNLAKGLRKLGELELPFARSGLAAHMLVPVRWANAAPERRP
jgi:hypothetical protein